MIEDHEMTMSQLLLKALRATTHAINTNELNEDVLGRMGSNALCNTLLNMLARRGLVKNVAKGRRPGWWVALPVPEWKPMREPEPSVPDPDETGGPRGAA